MENSSQIPGTWMRSKYYAEENNCDMYTVTPMNARTHVNMQKCILEIKMKS